MTMKLADDCFFHDKDRMPHDEALAVLKSRVRPVVDIESIDLHLAQGRYLAESVLAPRDIPAHDNAAVDGYAFSHSAYDRQAGARLKIVGETAAGHPDPTRPSSDDAIRIFTGAVMPDGFDTVVMQEDVRIDEQSGQTWVMIPPGLKRGANRRLAGEDAEARRRAGRGRCALAATRRGERRRVRAGPASLLRTPEGCHRLDRRRDHARGRSIRAGQGL